MADMTGQEPAWTAGPVRSVNYSWYDTFNEPFGEWWDLRYLTYDDLEVVSDTYPHIHRTLDAGLPCGYYSSMRLNITATGLPEVNMNDGPQFLPMLGSERGGNATIDWYMQYLTVEEVERYPEIPADWMDGYIIGLNGTVTLDRTASMAVLGVTSEGFDDFDTWWDANSAQFNVEYADWIMDQANHVHDIFCMYAYMFLPLSIYVQAEKIGDEVVLTYDSVTWGMECLVTSWLRAAFMPTEWLFEDFSMHAEIGPDTADIQIDAAVPGAVTARMNTESGQPSWAWEGMLQDYVPSSGAHPDSDFDAYVDLEHVDMRAGSWTYGAMTPFDYTPGSFDLSEGERMSFEWPAGAQTFIVDWSGVDYLTADYEITGPYSEPADYDLPSNVMKDTESRTLTFEGPMDLLSWSCEQTAHENLSAEWDRLGVLPYGMPWIEFKAGTEAVAPTSPIIGGVPDLVRVNQTVDITVSYLDQFGSPYEDYLGTVHFWSSDPYAMLPEDYTFVEADAGCHSFNVTFYSEGSYSLSVADEANVSVATVWTEVLPAIDMAMWTLMVYLDADNDLEEFGVEDFLEMATAGSTDDVNILVQFDRSPDYDAGYGDWDGTLRFVVSEGMLPYAESAAEDLGELNMGDPETLSDFISWGTDNYPADKYLLVLWDHGGGWDGAVCWDETDWSDALTMDEVETALSASERIDILGYDACLMGMAEVIYETKEHVDYVVASEEVVPSEGWPYDTIVGDLVADPTMTSAGLSSCIVTRYMEYYGTSGNETIGAVEMAAAETMFASLEAFAVELVNALPEHEDVIRYCRTNSTSFADPSYIDLDDFAFNVGDFYTNPELGAAADELRSAIDAAVIAEGHSDTYWCASGVSIYFPATPDWYWPEYGYTLDFTADTSWDEFLELYLTIDEDDYEPDDDYENATELVASVTQSHTLHEAEDVDWYFFTLLSEEDVQIRTQSTYGSWGYLSMWLYDEMGVPDTEIAYAEGWGADTLAVIDEHLGQGTYYVKVGSFLELMQMDGYDITLYAGDIPNIPPEPLFFWYPSPVDGQPVTFDGSFSYDTDGWIVSYVWDFGDGGYAEGAVVEHTYDYPGTYTVALAVVDDDGAISVLESEVVVEEASAGDEYEPDDTYDQASPIGLGEMQNHSIAPGGADVDWVTFDLADETNIVIDTEIPWEGDTVIALYDEEGVPETCIARNDDNEFNMSSRIVMTLPAGTYWVEVWSFEHYDEIPLYYLWVYETAQVNQPPVPDIQLSDAEPDVDQDVLFDGSDSYDPDGWIYGYRWDFGDGVVYEGDQATHAYEEAGEYLVTLTVFDDMGAGASVSTVVSVQGDEEPVPEPPVAAVSYSPALPLVGETVTFDAGSSYDSDGTIETYSWDFGDGATASGETATHVYAHDGVYVVTLTVEDNSSLTDEATVTLTVASGLMGLVATGDGDPIDNATVAVYAQDSLVVSALTGADGTFLIRNLAPGEYDVTISKDGYDDVNRTVTIEDGVLDLGTITMTPTEEPPEPDDDIPSWALWAGVVAVAVCAVLIAAFLMLGRKKT